MSGCGNYSRFGRETDENDEDEQNLVRNEGEKYRQYQGAILAALAGTAAGTGDGWLLMSIVKHNEDPLNNNNVKLFSYIMNFAAIMGVIVAGYLVDKIGRKQTLILAGLMTLPTWILYMISHKILISLSIGTALGGFASGIVSVAVPLYIAEISEISVRGTLGSFFYLQFIAGELFTVIEGPDINLKAVAGNCILVATIFLVTFIWMPESPFYLMLKGQEDEAKMSIKFFRGANYHIEEELENLKQSVSKRTTIKEALKEDNAINALIISFILMFISRILALDGFNFRLYKAWFRKNADGHARLTTLFLAIQVIGTGAAAFFIERLGRRLLLIISASFMAFSVISATIFDLFFVQDGYTIPFAFLAIYLAACSFGVGPVPWVLMNELLPHQHKALSSTLSAALFWFMASTSLERFKGIRYLMGPEAISFGCLLSCVIVIILAVYMIPETKGKNVNMILVPNIKNFFVNLKNRVTNIHVV